MLQVGLDSGQVKEKEPPVQLWRSSTYLDFMPTLGRVSEAAVPSGG